jgi:hypothetical protein
MSGAATESEAAAANASPRKDLAVRRTKIANEGMLITCVRTVPSMIDLGFAIYQSKLQRSKITDRDPKNVGLMLDGPSLMAASVQSSRSVHDRQSRVPFGRAGQSCAAHRHSHCGVGCSGVHQHRAPCCPFSISGTRVKETANGLEHGGLHANAKGDTCRRQKYWLQQFGVCLL